MATTDDSPILIGSDDDDDDSDVVVIKEEKVEDDDVIFLSETAPTQVPKSDSKQPLSLISGSLNRSLSISSNFRVSLNLSESSDVTEISAPLDLSSRGRSSEGSSLSDSSSIMGLESSDTALLSESDQASSSGVVSSSSTDDFLPPDLVPVSSSDSLHIPVMRTHLEELSAPSVTSSSDVGLAADVLNIDSDSQGTVTLSSSTGVDIVNHSRPLVSSGNTLLGIGASVTGSSFMISNLLGNDNRDSDISDLSSLSQMTGGRICTSTPTQVATTSVLSVGPNPKPVDFAQCLEFLDSLSLPRSFNSDHAPSSSSSNVSAPSVTCVSSSDLMGGQGPSTSTGPTLTLPFWPLPSSFATSNASAFSSSSFTVHHTTGDKTTSLSNSHCQTSPAATRSVSCNSKPLCSSNFHSNNVNYNTSAMKQLPPKKQARCFQHNPTSQAQSPLLISWGSDKCTCCKMSLVGMLLSRCVLGHATCGSCLEDKVKLVLTGKTKESIKCMESGCNSYYPMSELKHSLPSMVVEILEDKLDQEYVDYVANMILGNTSHDDKACSVTKSENVHTDCGVRQGQEGASSRVGDGERKMDDIPPNWIKFDNKTGWELIALEPESAEYIEVALKFHNTMLFPQADIVRVLRLQNPILWRYYCVKRMEMLQDNDGLAVEERQLFHGTNASVVDAICRKGFDWRVCGKHGTLYGQGSYFAVNASYSHQYTERPRMVVRARKAIAPVRRPGLTNISTVPSVGLIFQYLQQVSLPPPPAHSGITQNTIVPSSPTLAPASSTLTQPSVSQSSSQAGLIGSPPILPLPTPSTSLLSTTLSGNKMMARRIRPRTCCYSRRPPLSTPDGLLEPPTIRKLFLAKALVGKYTGGDSGLRKPPPLHPCTDPFGKCYDSCVDNIFNPTIFVIFDSAQTYPEYLIEYTYSD